MHLAKVLGVALVVLLSVCRLEAVPISLAVLPIQSADQERALSADVGALLEFELGLMDRFRVVDRAALETVLDEQAIGLSGAIDSDTAAKVGQLTGVDMLIGGRLIKTGDRRAPRPHPARRLVVG